MIFGYKIEALGPLNFPTINRTLRFASDLLPDDPDGVYRTIAKSESFQTYPSAADFQDGEAETGSLAFSLLFTEEVRFWLARKLELRLATLTVAVTSYTETTITLDREDLEGQVIFVGREGILLGTHTGGGVYTGCIRGYWGTQATAHIQDPAAFRLPHPLTIPNRVVTFFVVPTDGTYDDEVPLQQFGIQRLLLTRQDLTSSLRLNCLSFLDVLRLARPVPNQWRGRTDVTREAPDWYLDQWADDWWPIHPQDTPGELAFKTPTGTPFTVEINEKVYYAELDPDSDPDNPRWRYKWRSPMFSATNAEQPDYNTEARQVWTTSPLIDETAALGYEGSIYRGDAITVTLNILLSQPGVETAYSLNHDFGVRIPELGIDVEACEQLRALIQNEIQVPLFTWGRDKDRDNLSLKLIEERLLNPFGLSFGDGPSGGLSIVRMFDAAPIYETTPNIEDIDLIAQRRTEYDFNIDEAATEIEVRYQDVPGAGVKTFEANDANLSTRRLGKAGSVSLNAGAVIERERAADLGAQYSLRWRNAPPIFRFSTSIDKLLRVGQGANLTYEGAMSFRSDHGGYPVEGCEDSRIVIFSRALGLEVCDYEAFHVGYFYDRVGRRTSSAAIVAYDDPTRTFTVSLQNYVRSRHPTYTNDAESFQVGDVIQWRSGADGTQVASGLVITAITLPDQIEVAVSPGALVPGPGDVILNDTFAASSVDQTDRHAYFSDTDGLVDGDPGYQYQG